MLTVATMLASYAFYLKYLPDGGELWFYAKLKYFHIKNIIGHNNTIVRYYLIMKFVRICIMQKDIDKDTYSELKNS